MGSWGRGAFQNDQAADFLRELGESAAPEQLIVEALTRVNDAKPTVYLDVDDGQRCVAACELVALAHDQGAAPKPVLHVLQSLGSNRTVLRLATRALPRVLDARHSELAGLIQGDTEMLEALYARLVAAHGDDASPPRVDVGALLRQPPAPRESPLRPMPWGPSTPPNLAKMYGTPALRSATIALGTTWVLVGQGVLNVYGDLDEHGLALVLPLKVALVQFGRRFRVSGTTIALVDQVFEKYPAAPLSLTLNGHGAFDDLSVLEQLPHLRRVVLTGRVGLDAAGVLSKYTHLLRATVNGASASRA